MKKFLCLILACITVFSLTACGKKIVVDKKPHVEPFDMVYDKTEIIALDELYEYCGFEYELVDLVDYISVNYNGTDVFNIVCEEENTDYANELAFALEEAEVKYTINGEQPYEDEQEEESPTDIAE